MTDDWQQLIEYAEMKLGRAKVKVSQLEALIRVLRVRAKNGEPSPIALAKDISVEDLIKQLAKP